MYALSNSAISVPSNHDRLGVSVFCSVLAHMVIILATAFVLPELTRINTLSSLEITLVQTASERAPDNPDVLAQVNQDGGGDSDRPDIARSPLPARELGEQQIPLQSTPQLPNRSRREVLDILTMRSDLKARGRDSRPDKKDSSEAPLQIGLMTPEEIRAERARGRAEIDREWQEFQKRPRRKFLNASTQEYRYAAYMESWRAKTERIGNLNYPDEARRRQLIGSVLIDVIIRSDGAVKDVTVMRSSNHPLLDDAAKRFVRLSAPYPPFPPHIRAEVDELSITRTFSFNEIFRTD